MVLSQAAVQPGFLIRLWVFLTTPVQQHIAYWLKNEFAPMLPRKWRRMLYVASVIALTSFTDTPDFVVFGKINDLLKLTYKGESYWINKFFRDMIWKSIIQENIELGEKSIPVTRVDQEVVTNAELDQICEYFLNRTPDWIIYASPKIMRNDLRICLMQLFSRRYGMHFN